MVSVREASVEDAAELLEIYRPYVEHTDVSFEYVTPSVQDCTHTATVSLSGGTE